MVSPLFQYASRDIDRKYYYLCGILHPQSAGMLAATVSFLMYLAVVVYICCTGYWYAFATIFIALVCWSQFMIGAYKVRRIDLEPLITLTIIFELALAALIGLFIYFTVVSEGNGTEYGVVVGVLSLLFILNALCLRTMITFDRFVDILSTYLATQGSMRSSDESSTSCIKDTPRSSFNASVASSLPPKEGAIENLEAPPYTTGKEHERTHAPSSSTFNSANSENDKLEGYLNEVAEEQESLRF
uniref:MARVEL domain-containing protein n=1 Tax=Ascaris lumbricoides TaxID=6252 RepID=A0A0M3I051_ASCLU